MRIHTFWTTRRSDRGFNPELVAAWDEFSVESNVDGWQEAKRKAIEKFSDDLDQKREVILSVDDTSLERVFKQPEIQVDIVS